MNTDDPGDDQDEAPGEHPDEVITKMNYAKPVPTPVSDVAREAAEAVVDKCDKGFGYLEYGAVRHESSHIIQHAIDSEIAKATKPLVEALEAIAGRCPLLAPHGGIADEDEWSYGHRYLCETVGRFAREALATHARTAKESK